MNEQPMNPNENTTTRPPQGMVLHGFLPEEALLEHERTDWVCYIPESRPRLTMAQHNIALAKKFKKQPIVVTDLTLGYLVEQNAVTVFKTAYYDRTASDICLPAGGWLLWVLSVHFNILLHAYAAVRDPETWHEDDVKSLKGVRVAPQRTRVLGDPVETVPVKEAPWVIHEPRPVQPSSS